MYPIPRSIAVFLLFCLVGFAPSAFAEAPRMVDVTGEASVRVAPDQADVRFAVVTRGEEPGAVRADNEAAASAALDAVRELGIAEEDIRMEGLRLQPRHEYDAETRAHREAGFEAVRDVHVRVRDLTDLPDLVAVVVDAGANRIQEVRYDLADRTPARNEALQEAARAARDKAVVLVRALDAELGPLLELREQQFHFGIPRMARLDATAEAASGDPAAYAPGEIEIEARVEVRFGIRGGDSPWFP